MGPGVADMSGKRVIVTGANSGIGRTTALQLAGAGAEIILVCRNPQRGEEALGAIREATGSELVSLMLCDISSREEIRRFGAEFRKRFDRLDVLVNNAGAYFAEHRQSVDGLELTFALNHMGYFQMVAELIGCIKASPAGRIVNVSSQGHRLGGLNWEDLFWERRSYRAMRAYCDSKLMNILFTRELARRLEGSSVTANCLHPGVIRSGFAVHESGSFAFLARLGAPFLSSPEKGARTTIFLASSPDLVGQSGGYFVHCRRRRPSKAARDDEAAARLWQLSEGLLEATEA
jgi:NAD(P)-dependent dehydrogenase (short-subunit alcohol dehydrogenase family)